MVSNRSVVRNSSTIPIPYVNTQKPEKLRGQKSTKNKENIELKKRTQSVALPIFSADEKGEKSSSQPKQLHDPSHYIHLSSKLALNKLGRRQKLKSIFANVRNEKALNSDFFAEKSLNHTKQKIHSLADQLSSPMDIDCLSQEPFKQANTSISSPFSMHQLHLSLENLNIKNLKVVKHNLSNQVLEFLEKEGLRLSLSAQEKGVNHLVELEDTKFAFTRSGKIYLLTKKLGTGKFKSTFEAMLVAVTSLELMTTQTRRALALTHIQTPPSISQPVDELALKNEIAINQYLKEQSKRHDLSHICIPKSVSYMNQNQIGMITELFDGDINALLLSYTLQLKECCELAQKMAVAVHQLHQINVVHRDLKPDNFLFRYNEEGYLGEVKLTDFGLSSRLQENERYETKIFPYYYVDPQWHADKGYKNDLQYSKESDIYQLGVTFYQLFKGDSIDDLQNYFHFSIQKKDNQFIKEFKQHPEKWADFEAIGDKDIQNMLLSMLNSEPTRRPTAEQVSQFFYNKLLQIPQTLNLTLIEKSRSLMNSDDIITSY